MLPVVLDAAARGEMTFGDFYKDRFLVMKTSWSDPHGIGFTYIMDRFILPKFGRLAVPDIDKVMSQALLNPLAGQYSHSTLRHIRGKMVEVLEEAL